MARPSHVMITPSGFTAINSLGTGLAWLGGNPLSSFILLLAPLVGGILLVFGDPTIRRFGLEELDFPLNFLSATRLGEDLSSS